MYICIQMALKIKGQLSINSDNTEYTLEDITGDYDATDNPNGFGGSVNKTKAQVLETQVRVTKPNGEYVDFTLNTSTSPLTDFIPKEALSRILTLADLGISDESEFPVGVYQVQYIIWVKVDDSMGASYTLEHDTVLNKVYAKVVGTSSNFTSVLLGFGDTSVVRVLKNSDTTIYEDFSIKEVVDNTHMTLDQLSTKFGLTTDGASVAVQLRAGYKSTFAYLNKEQFLKCFLPKVAGITVTGSKGCGDPSCAMYQADKEINDLTEMHLGMFAVEAQLEYGMWDEANKNMKTLYKVCNTNKCGC